MGVLLFFMVVGNFPFYAENDDKIRVKVLTGEFRVPFFMSLGLSYQLENIIRT